MMLRWVSVLWLALAGTALAQRMDPWTNLDSMILSSLTASGQAEAAFWLPDSADPAQVTRGLGIAYEHIPGSAGSTSIAVGYFTLTEGGWTYARKISGLFGQSPRDPVYAGSTIELTTTMLGPNEPRCCPTLPVRWRIDLTTGAVARLN